MSNSKPQYRQLSLAVKYNTVLFPFDTVLFLQAISKQGFILSDEIGPIPSGARLQLRGRVATKGDISIRVDTDRHIVAVEVLNPESAIEQLDLIESLLHDDLAFDSSGLIHFYEFGSDLVVKSVKNPLESWQTHFAHVPVIEKISNILGRETALYGVTVALKGADPNQSNWFDLRINPQILSATNNYAVKVVFRDAERDEVIGFVRGFEDTLSKLLAIVEQGDVP